TDTVASSITGAQSGITVNPAGAATLAVTGLANPSTAGYPSTFAVTAKDAFGNTATSYAGTVHFTTSPSDTQALLPANSTLTAGVAAFSASLLTSAASRALAATDTVTGSIMGSQTVAVNPAATARLVVSGFASPATAGTSSSFTITAKDLYGNVTPGYG